MPNNILSLLLFDIDYDEAMPEHFKLSTPNDVRDSLIKLYPALEGVSMLIRTSSSSGIYNSVTGEKRSQNNSYHVYITLVNSTAETNKNFLEFTKRRAWLPEVNLAYAKITGAGVCEYYYIDQKVLNSAERLIVESNPILEAPLAKEIIPSVIFEGGVLDLASIDYNLEPDYRETYAQEKAKLITTIPATDKPVSATVSSQTLVATTKSEAPIFISKSAKAKIIDIYLYLLNTPKPTIKKVKAVLDDEVTSALIKHLGYNVDHNYKFKLRAEKTPSCSIAHNGYIKDFGADFAGGIIDFIMYAYNINFKMSWLYLSACFGIKMSPLPMNLQGVLPAPTNFEKRLEVNTNNFKGLI